MPIDSEPLERRLRRQFGGPPGESRVVVRQAVDLDGSGRYEADTGNYFDNELVMQELTGAADGTPADRWNWWMGSLEVVYGGYEEFAIRRYRRE